MHDLDVLRNLALIVGLAIPVAALAHRLRVPTLVGFLLGRRRHRPPMAPPSSPSPTQWRRWPRSGGGAAAVRDRARALAVPGAGLGGVDSCRGRPAGARGRGSGGAGRSAARAPGRPEPVLRRPRGALVHRHRQPDPRRPRRSGRAARPRGHRRPAVPGLGHRAPHARRAVVRSRGRRARGGRSRRPRAPAGAGACRDGRPRRRRAARGPLDPGPGRRDPRPRPVHPLRRILRHRDRAGCVDGGVLAGRRRVPGRAHHLGVGVRVAGARRCHAVSRPVQRRVLHLDRHAARPDVGGGRTCR